MIRVTGICVPLQVMQALKASPQIMELLKGVEADVARYSAHPSRRPDGLYAELLPVLVEQRKQWETFASAGLTSLDVQVIFTVCIMCDLS